MEKFLVNGGNPLYGKVRVGGAKNAVLPVIAAALLADGPSYLENVPHLSDVSLIVELIGQLGAHVDFRGNDLTIDATEIRSQEAPYDSVRKMRASFLLMGPLLARYGKAEVSLPGGCAIGTRPIDLHLKGFTALGAKINKRGGYIEAVAPQLTGARIYLDFPSVGATENIIMAATLAEGVTVIENAAEEPEIVDLAQYINSMGGKVKGAGSSIIEIEGVPKGVLRGTTHRIIPDRVEAGTYMVAAAITGGDVTVDNVIVEHLKPVMAKLEEAGARVLTNGKAVRVIGGSRIYPVDVQTMPYPGFPTDMQAQMMALMTVANGTSVFTETVFENRYMHVDELSRMGADIKIDGRVAVIKGVGDLNGAPVNATDLRGGAALILAGLAARGKTEIGFVHHIDRGYEQMEAKLNGLGARIERLAENH
ncbi:MAG: UDP-N-acetylglucosamine 1-carboxyvinyltransferase [Bacillota bacterium]